MQKWSGGLEKGDDCINCDASFAFTARFGWALGSDREELA